MRKKESISATDVAASTEKPFPRRCAECGKTEVWPATIAYDAEVKHDGRLYAFRITRLKINKCRACGEILFSNVSNEQVTQALRDHLGLLSPTQIRESLSNLGMMQKDFAERIGVAPETVSRWIGGTHIQSRAMDNLMRLFFRFDNVRSALPAIDVDNISAERVPQL